MAMKVGWEENKVSTVEDILKQIAEQMPQPVGIMLFGIDSDLKTEVYMKCVEELPMLAHGYGTRENNIPIDKAAQPFRDGRNVLVMLDDVASNNHGARHQIVMTLRKLGAASVVGIYARVWPKPVRPLVSSPETVQFNKRLSGLMSFPPTPEGLDRLYTATEQS